MSNRSLSIGDTGMKKSFMRNILSYEKKLHTGGLTEKQAYVHAEAAADLIDSLLEGELASKSDIKDLSQEIQKAIKELELKLTIRFAALVVGALAMFMYLKNLS